MLGVVSGLGWLEDLGTWVVVHCLEGKSCGIPDVLSSQSYPCTSTHYRREMYYMESSAQGTSVLRCR